ncbi:MAG: AraC family ligand binding domain-containing protein [Myxococcales bacterium]|nr:AraC family ligand binding domain-containing protein [Myxococcales bacterium]
MTDVPRFVRRDLFGGRGEVAISDLLGADAAPPFTAVLDCELEAGGRVGVHLQEHYPEIVVCTGGAGWVELDGARHAFAPGQMIYLPLGSTLALECAEGAPLRYLIIKAALKA